MILSILDTAAGLAPPVLALAAALAQLVTQRRKAGGSGQAADTAGSAAAPGGAVDPAPGPPAPVGCTVAKIVVITVLEYRAEPGAGAEPR